VKRTYRITEDHDKKVKDLSGEKSESQVIRDAIEAHEPKKPTPLTKEKN